MALFQKQLPFCYSLINAGFVLCITKLSSEQILRVTFGLLVASVINALLVWSVSLGCWLSLGGFAVVLSEL